MSLLILSQFKGPHSGLRQFLIIESPLKMMENPFYFMLKALFFVEIFIFLSCLFDYVEKRLDKKVDFKDFMIRLVSKIMTS